jgi:class 3 adenylate cyclase
MARNVGKTSRPLIAILAGLLATLAVLLAWSLGATRRAELATLDMRFRHFSPQLSTGQVVHVDIDDSSLETIGRWPWPRAELAGIIETLQQCGARTIALDLIFPEPQDVRFIDETADLYAGPAVETLGRANPQPVYDDAVFAHAIATTPTLVPMFLSQDAEPIENVSLINTMAEYLDRHPQAPLAATVDAVNLPPDVGRPELAAAYCRARAHLAIRRLALPADAAGELNIPQGDIVPPLVTLAAATRATGFVSFEPDIDGVLRRMAMLAESPDGVFPQLALATVADAHAPSAETPAIQSRDGRLKVQLGETLAEIPVDDRGRLLINWPRESVYRRWIREQHIPARAVAEVGRQRAAIRRNQTLKRLTQLQLARDRSSELVELFAQADEIALARRNEQRQRYLAMLYTPADVPPADEQLAQAEREVEQRIDETFAAFRTNIIEGLILAHVPDTPEARRQAAAMQSLLDRIDRVDAENAAKARLIEVQLARLRDRIAGKVCFIGSTASGAADFVSTPLGVRMPGVEVHGWIYETIASGNYIQPAPEWLNVGVIVLCGLLLSVVAARSPVPFTALAAVALAVGYVGVNAKVVFVQGGMWLELVAPLAAMVASLLAVTAYRQLTEERAKRQIRAMFSHALSPTLVDELIENPDIARLGGQQRNVTCMFSDLAHFTPLSERLGPQRTVSLLNRYFDGVTEAVQQRGGGYLNKFLGDGIFCFFGAPVMQEDHAQRAVRAALACRQGLAALNESPDVELPEGMTLGIRVGIATGEAMVGNCGSSQRMDYTAIGDCVNLAARLEAANKFFGTDVLVSETTWQAITGEAFLARPLGQVLVTGQSASVAVWDVVSEAPGDARQQEAVAAFAAGMMAFEARRLEEAISHWQAVEAIWPGDAASAFYIKVARHALQGPADETSYATHSGKGIERIVYPWA